EAPPPDQPIVKIPARSYLGDDFTLSRSVRSPEDLTPFERASVIIDEATQGTEHSRAEAREHWKIRRLMLPFEYRERVEASKDWKDEYASGVKQLKKWMGSFRHRSSQAKAGQQAAELLNLAGDYAGAVALCQEVEKRFPIAAGAKDCGRLRA